MNQRWAKAWDEVEDFARKHDGQLDRDGHRFFASWHVEHAEVQVWAEQEPPAYGLRIGPLSARFWNLGSMAYTYEALLVAANILPLDRIDQGQRENTRVKN